MEKRKLDKLGIETSLIGFGCMRFPVLENGKIDVPEAERMMDKAIAEGVNYIDTAYPYHDGQSELVVGKVLKKYGYESKQKKINGLPTRVIRLPYKYHQSYDKA